MSTLLTILKIAHSELEESKKCLQDAYEAQADMDRCAAMYKAASQCLLAKERIEDMAKLFSEGGLRLISKALESTLFQMLSSSHPRSIKASSCSIDIAIILIKDIIEVKQD